MNKKTMYVAQAGMIAAVYAAATLITLLALQGLAWGPVQFRISEAVSYTHLDEYKRQAVGSSVSAPT